MCYSYFITFWWSNRKKQKVSILIAWLRDTGMALNESLQIQTKYTHPSNTFSKRISLSICLSARASQVALLVKNPSASAGDARDRGLIPGSGRSPGAGNTTCFSILPWEIPWTEEPGGLQSTGSQWVRHDWAHNLITNDIHYGLLHKVIVRILKNGKSKKPGT